MDLLRQIDANAGFSLFWMDLIEPLLRYTKARHLLEIGAYRGDNTRLLVKYCNVHDGVLTVIEPTVLPSLQEIIDQSNRIKLLENTSRNALLLIDAPVDAVMLEGDLNYHTIHSDLADIEKMAKRFWKLFPLVFLRATGWPYARRDMYYDPSDLPVDGVHNYSRKGMTPWSCHLVANMINYPFANAQEEGGPRNGVLTAAEDFMKKTELPLKLLTLPIHNGVSVIFTEGSPADTFMQDYVGINPFFIRLLETVEVARLNSIISKLKEHQSVSSGFAGRWEHRLHHLVRIVFNLIR